MRAVVVCALLLGACSSSGTFELKIDAKIDDSVTNALVATISSFNVEVSGDETFAGNTPVKGTPGRQNELTYTPQSMSSRTIEVAVEAQDDNANILAAGQSGAITLAPDETTSTTITLSATTSP